MWQRSFSFLRLFFFVCLSLFISYFSDPSQNVSHVHEVDPEAAAARGLVEPPGGADHGVQADPSLHGASQSHSLHFSCPAAL